jgi:hypothetical protein
MSNAVLNERAEIFANRIVTELLIRHLAQSNPNIVTELRQILGSWSPIRPETEYPGALMPSDRVVRERVQEMLRDAERGPSYHPPPINENRDS